ncbi:MAG: hypothetical protein Q8Q31_02595 [Nanoarchaeota archaeon]|nr:hypothetical protein [Nanoarchaeota archaeon]
MEIQEEPPDPANETQKAYVRAILSETFIGDSSLVQSLDLGGVNGHSLSSRAESCAPRDMKHFDSFYIGVLKHAARRVRRYDSELLASVCESSPVDLLSGSLFRDSLKLLYASKYPDKVERRQI